MEAVGRKLDVALAAQTPDYRTTYAAQVAELRKLEQDDRQGLIERVAYTWFNRLAALRYLDARGWHPFRARVLTPATPAETQPELLRLMRTGALPEELQRYTDVGRLNDLLDGRIPSADPQSEVYRHLVLAACRFYHSLLPDLFERLDDETELLLPDDLLTEHSVVQGFRTEISDEDCAEVEVLGWLYQFYISEKKDAVMARKSAVPSEDIPAVTQLFTPHWIVRYLVENSLGRLWLLNRPSSRLREQMPYYIEGEAETDFLKVTRPEEIRLIDPAVGSGHMLAYAFDLLYAVYEEEGYAPSEIPGLILSHNVYGVDIDPRAAQLASLALVLKAREKSRRFFQREQLMQPHVIALEDVHFSERELREYVTALDLGELFDQPVLALLGQFEEATTFGSLIQPVLGGQAIQQLRRQIETKELGSELFLSETHQKVLRALEQAEYLTQRYHVAVANPPYMGRSGMIGTLRSYVDSTFPSAKHNLFSVFIDRLGTLVVNSGRVGMVTMQNWMFLSRFADFRKQLFRTQRLDSLLHLGPRAFDSISGEVVQTAAFTFSMSAKPEHTAEFFRLVDGEDSEAKRQSYLEALGSPGSQRHYRVPMDRFSVVQEEPLCYWASMREFELFRDNPVLGTQLVAREGMATGNNDRFLRLWHEVAQVEIGYGCSSVEESVVSRKRWFPYNKGGGELRWFGNNDYLVDWKNDGSDIRGFRDEATGRVRSHNYNGEYSFREGITWSSIGSGRLSARYSPEGFLFDAKGTTAFAEREPFFFIGLLNSRVGTRFISLLSPTLDFKIGHVLSLPLLDPPNLVAAVATFVREAITIAEADWDNVETSWGFRDLPLLRTKLKRDSLAESWSAWKEARDADISLLQGIETENNRLWIEAYGLEDELSPEVPEDEITLARADKRQDAAAFLSYAVGCMLGRYSLDAAGLILANAGDTLENYLAKVGKPLDDLTFAPDADGIIPVLDGEWFEDDIVARTREFLRATFGEETLRENIRFIEESLGKDLRKYFLTDFYKDHLQTYNKRPIYWMVQSPRKGFSVFIYLHRYTRDIMNLVLNRYLREYQAKLRDRLAHLARVQANESLSARDRTAAGKEADKLTKVLHECEEWERQTVLPLAQERIELDLDDGVKVNYAKLGEALAPVPGLS
jgi:hypothetical protein